AAISQQAARSDEISKPFLFLQTSDGKDQVEWLLASRVWLETFQVDPVIQSNDFFGAFLFCQIQKMLPIKLGNRHDESGFAHFLSQQIEIHFGVKNIFGMSREREWQARQPRCQHCYRRCIAREVGVQMVHALTACKAPDDRRLQEQD